MNNLSAFSLANYLSVFNNDVFFKKLFNNLLEGAFLVDSDKKILYWNRTAGLISGFDKDDIINTYCNEDQFKHCDKEGNPLSSEECPLSLCMDKGTVITKKSIVMHKNGLMIPVILTAIPLKDNENKVIGAMEVFLDDSTQQEIENTPAVSHDFKAKDNLTNLYVKNEIIERIQIEMQKADRYEVPVCLCICNVDNLKDINKQHGNHVGELVLRRVSELLRSHLRRTDIIGLYGEEGTYIILLPLIDLHRANIAIEKLKKVIDNTIIEIIDPKKVTMSFGLTEIIHDDTIENFIDRAECALYKAKKLGEDRIEIFT